MKIPNNVKILYKIYAIEETENLHDVGTDLYGKIYYFGEKILLNNVSFEEQKKETGG